MVRMSLKNCLLGRYTAVELRDKARRIGLSGEENSIACAQKLAESMLKIDNFRNVLLLLHDDEIRFMDQACAKEEGFRPAESQYGAADALFRLDYGFIVSGSREFVIPADVRLAYQHIRTDEFEKKRKKMSWLADCVRMIPVIYLTLEEKDLYRMYGKRKNFEESDSELKTLLDEYLKMSDCPCVRKGDILISKVLEEKGITGKILKIQEKMPANLVPYSEVRQITEHGYPYTEKEWKLLKKFFVRKCGCTADYADMACGVVWMELAAGADPEMIGEDLAASEITVPESERKNLENMISLIRLNVRMSYYRGMPLYQAAGEYPVPLSEEEIGK